MASGALQCESWVRGEGGGRREEESCRAVGAKKWAPFVCATESVSTARSNARVEQRTPAVKPADCDPLYTHQRAAHARPVF